MLPAQENCVLVEMCPAAELLLEVVEWSLVVGCFATVQMYLSQFQIYFQSWQNLERPRCFPAHVYEILRVLDAGEILRRCSYRIQPVVQRNNCILQELCKSETGLDMDTCTIKFKYTQSRHIKIGVDITHSDDMLLDKFTWLYYKIHRTVGDVPS